MADIIEVSHYNLHKHKEVVAGDTVLVNRTIDERLVATLADGMGSGVKANVLSQLTACMSQKFMMANVDTIHAAQTIMETLPVCSKRKVSYSTLTSLNISPEGFVKLLEYDNPDLLWHHDGGFIERDKCLAHITTEHTRNKTYYSELQLEFGDRLVFYSDGVTQAGMGGTRFPLGWREENVKRFIESVLAEQSDITGKDLARRIVEEACVIDKSKAKDDITCAVVYFRKAKHTLLLTGPPSKRDRCQHLVDSYKQFDGVRIIAGGTTAQIVSEGVSEELAVDMSDIHSTIPPRAIMKSADLVTEGMLTINKVIKILEEEDTSNLVDSNAAYRMAELLLDSDNIYILMGTAINEAHQNPNMPVEMGLRRISINKLSGILENKFLKKTTIEYV